jgi:hypothetical protein
MNDVRVLHCLLQCHYCRASIDIPHGSLGHIFSSPEHRTTDAPAVVVACHLCKRLQTFEPSIPTNSVELVLGQAELRLRSLDTVHVADLECEAEDCQVLLPLFAQWRPDTSEQERRADIETWVWDGLRCPQGHEIVRRLE